MQGEEAWFSLAEVSGIKVSTFFKEGWTDHKFILHAEK